MSNHESEHRERTLIAWLHCELPTNGKAQTASPSSGTLDLGEVEGDGPTAQEVIPLYQGQSFRLGRARANDLVIEHPSVSRFHAVFSASENGVVLSDLSSLNGTTLNGRRISTPVDINTGNVVGIGPVKITIELARGVSGGKGVVAQEEEATLVNTHAARMSTAMVTVLVVDVCGFTSMSQALPAQDVADMLNKWFGVAVAAILSEGGEIDKYIGDCVMALWRDEHNQGLSSAVRAVRAAQRILEQTKLLAQKKIWAHQEEFPWACRAALNTGEALIGAVGSTGAREHTVLGDTVNVAFRLESLASTEGASLVLSENTAALVRDMISLRSLGEVILEGRKNTLEIFTVEAEL